jgi:phospholipase C
MGQNDGFVTEFAGADQAVPMGYYLREQLPAIYAIADGSVLCDRWFCSVLGPTWPNRFYLHGATSSGNKSNTPIFGAFTSVFEALEAKGITTRNYFHDIAWRTASYFAFGNNAGIETFFDDAAAGTLPQFSIIDPQYSGAGANDDHPEHDIALGQTLIAAVYNALAQSPQWGQCLLVIIYDEHGGFFDHVPPPATTDADPEFAQLGFRVPAVVAGPFVRKGCIVSAQLEHVSVISTVTKRYGLDFLNDRVTATSDLSCCIDPSYLDAPQKPLRLPMVKVSASRLRERASQPQEIHHPEMWAVADAGLIPPHLDRRDQVDEITRRVLTQARRLGAVKIVD